MKAYKEDSSYTRIAVLETIVDQTHSVLLRLETKLEKLDDKIENTRKENTTHFRATMGTLITLIGAPLMVKSIELFTKFITG